MSFALGLWGSLSTLFIHSVAAQSNITTPFSSSTSLPTPNGTLSASLFWLEEIEHQGVAPFQTNSSYRVFRNVKDFGAKGDGSSDDTAAINLAISTGGRCGPGTCQSSTTSPATVYFPSGTYRISGPIIDYYFTQMIGNPNSLPILKGTSNFTGLALIDGDPYNDAGAQSFNSTDVFYRQIRNLVLDTTSVPANVSVNGIHWPTAQATSLQNLVFRMSEAKGTQHQGMLIENGSGGFMGDLVFYGGLVGAALGNQQFTSRNMSFHNCQQAINQLWDWGWTYKSITIRNCKVGLNVTSGGSSAQTVGSVVLIDSSIENTPIGILTAYSRNQSSMSNGSLVLENVHLKDVGIAVKGAGNSTALAGTTTSKTITAWAQGHMYTSAGRTIVQGRIPESTRPRSLLQDQKYYERSKPSYADVPASEVMSARNEGAKGNAIADDTECLQKAISVAASAGKILFVDAGIYRITKTLHIPAGSKIVGESYPVIMSSGSHFANMHTPKPVVQVGKSGHIGHVEWSDMVVSTQGHQAGAILIEWNLSANGAPSGMWDVHTRIGGFKGSGLQLADCPAVGVSSSNATVGDNSSMPNAPYSNSTTSYKLSGPTTTASPMYNNSSAGDSNSTSEAAPINKACIAAFMSMHITHSASNLYLENTWLWTADHDLDPPSQSPLINSNITVYTGRGLLVESHKGNIWFYATAAEHHSLYQLQFSNTHSIFASQLQTETAYYQPHPNIKKPFQHSARYHDPTISEVCKGNGTNCDGLALRIHESHNLDVYGAGLYSFYNDYNLQCSLPTAGTCQRNIFSIEGSQSRDINVYDLHTVSAENMVTRNGRALAKKQDNKSVFGDGIAVLRV